MSILRTSVSVFCLILPTVGWAADNGPITSITLSSGGLAEVVRKADIDSSGQINMTVPLDQVNDVLKSIVVYDQTGVVEGISLPGPNPLAETFKNLPFSEVDLQSPAHLLSKLQGTRVKLDKAGVQVEGMILGVSARDRGDLGEVHVVSVLSNDRIIGVDLNSDTQISFVEPDIRQKVAQALAAVGKGKSDGARTIALKVAGEGKREVSVSYVVPAPIWKTAYRVVTLPGDKARLQAWAVLENASGEDWVDVSVTLSSGAPVTLKQRLHDLYWKQRREVPIDVSAGYVPRVDTGAEADLLFAESEIAPPGAPPGARAAALGSAVQPLKAAPVAAANVGETQEGAITASFSLPWPVSLERGDTLSAPIVDKIVSAETVSLFQPESGLQHPIAAILIANETDASLPSGILTVYDADEGYVGDAQLSGMPVGERRMVSFATDKKVRIAQQATPQYQINSIKVVDGVLTASIRQRSSTRYVVQGAPDDDRTVIIEHPKQSGWDFSSPQLEDATATHHRLKILVPKGKTEELTAVSERVIAETFALATAEEHQLLNMANRSPDRETADKLKELAAMQSELSGIERQIRRLNDQKLAEAEDQQRHRANLAAVQPGADLYRRATRKLTESETRIESIDEEIVGLETRREDIRKELGDAIRTF